MSLYGLIEEDFNTSDYVSSNCSMFGEKAFVKYLEGSGRDLIEILSRLENLRKIAEVYDQRNRYLSRDSNRAQSE